MWGITSLNKASNQTFYFETLQDCYDFLYVFKDHWCNVKWTEPFEINERKVPVEQRNYIKGKNAKQRADNALNWGFSSLWCDEYGNKLLLEEDFNY